MSPAVRRRYRRASATRSQIGQPQQRPLADPGLGQLGFGALRARGVSARLGQLTEPVIGPAVVWSALQGTSELLVGLVVAAGLKQGGREGLPDRVIPVGRLHVWQRILQGR